MAQVKWKENCVVSIEVYSGIFVIAQMLKFPYLMFYNLFSDDGVWSDSSLEKVDVLFCRAVARQFLQKSNMLKQSDFLPRLNLELPRYWISPYHGNRKVTLWAGTEHERTFLTLGDKPGGTLIEMDILSGGGGYNSPVVNDSIDLDDKLTIDAYETLRVSLYPELNERLYLCYRLRRNADPAKDLAFARKLPLDYQKYIDIISGKVELSKLGY